MGGEYLKAVGPVVAQVGFVIFALVLLMVVPGARGPMLLVPLNHAAAARLVPLAIARDARLLAPGPVSGSLIVYGERSALLGPMWHAGVLVLASPSQGCSAKRAEARA